MIAVRNTDRRKLLLHSTDQPGCLWKNVLPLDLQWYCNQPPAEAMAGSYKLRSDHAQWICNLHSDCDNGAGIPRGSPDGLPEPEQRLVQCEHRAACGK